MIQIKKFTHVALFPFKGEGVGVTGLARAANICHPADAEVYPRDGGRKGVKCKMLKLFYYKSPQPVHKRDDFGIALNIIVCHGLLKRDPFKRPAT